MKNFRELKKIRPAIAVLVNHPTSFSELHDFVQGYITTV